MNEDVTDNVAKSRFELHSDEGIAVAAYERRGDVIAFTHTIVPKQLRGHGMAGKLIEGALTNVRRRGLRILPECAFVADYLARHPAQQDLVAD